MLWFSWKCRNDLIFNGRNTISSLSTAVISQVDLFHSSMAMSTSMINHQIGNKSSLILKWQLPPPGTWKLNFDGASKDNPRLSGGGGLIRDEVGNLIRAFVFKCGISIALIAKIWALLHGIELAAKLGVVKLVVETDSLVTSSLLILRSIRTHPDYFLTQSCWNVIDGMSWDFQIHHIHRQANVTEHHLA